MWSGQCVKAWSKTMGVLSPSSDWQQLSGLQLKVWDDKQILSDVDLCGHVAVKSGATASIAMVHRLGLGKVRHLAVGELWIQHHVRSGEKIRVSKMSGLGNPSDAQTKYLGPDPLRRATKACFWVPVDGGEKLTTKVGQEGLFC